MSNTEKGQQIQELYEIALHNGFSFPELPPCVTSDGWLGDLYDTTQMHQYGLRVADSLIDAGFIGRIGELTPVFRMLQDGEISQGKAREYVDAWVLGNLEEALVKDERSQVKKGKLKSIEWFVYTVFLVNQVGAKFIPWQQGALLYSVNDTRERMGYKPLNEVSFGRALRKLMSDGKITKLELFPSSSHNIWVWNEELKRDE